MLTSSKTPLINTRVLSRLISNAGFRRLIIDDDFKSYGKHLKRILQKGGIDVSERTSLKELLDISYQQLLKDYRYEFVYKTSLLNSFILEHYSLVDTIVLNEFKIGNSKADMVLVNGSNKVFEIKTELDSPERLKTQINDYYKAFSEVYIVTHYTLVDKYLNLVNHKVGLLSFNEDGKITVFREAEKHHQELDSDVMLKSLRKSEYLLLIKKLTGFSLKTDSFNLFKDCLAIAKTFEPKEVQYLFLQIIKNRISKEDSLILELPIPHFLKFSCYCLNLKENHYLALENRLSCNI
jgi:hypothetical protein